MQSQQHLLLKHHSLSLSSHSNTLIHQFPHKQQKLLQHRECLLVGVLPTETTVLSMKVETVCPNHQDDSIVCVLLLHQRRTTVDCLLSCWIWSLFWWDSKTITNNKTTKKSNKQKEKTTKITTTNKHFILMLTCENSHFNSATTTTTWLLILSTN